MKKFLTEWFAPYSVYYTNSQGDLEAHYSWTFADALEWTACSLREETVDIYKLHNHIASRSAS